VQKGAGSSRVVLFRDLNSRFRIERKRTYSELFILLLSAVLSSSDFYSDKILANYSSDPVYFDSRTTFRVPAR